MQCVSTFKEQRVFIVQSTYSAESCNCQTSHGLVTGFLFGRPSSPRMASEKYPSSICCYYYYYYFNGRPMVSGKRARVKSLAIKCDKPITQSLILFVNVLQRLKSPRLHSWRGKPSRRPGNIDVATSAVPLIGYRMRSCSCLSLAITTLTCDIC